MTLLATRTPQSSTNNKPEAFALQLAVRIPFYGLVRLICFEDAGTGVAGCLHNFR